MFCASVLKDQDLRVHILEHIPSSSSRMVATRTISTLVAAVLAVLSTSVHRARALATSVERQASLLPDNLMVAYQSWSECDDSVYTAVENGVNVVIWFAVNLAADETGAASLTGGPNRTCVEEKQAKLDSMGYGYVVHLLSVGGWDAAHPDTSFSAEEYFEAFEAHSDG